MTSSSTKFELFLQLLTTGELHFVQTSSSSSEISNWKWAMRKMGKNVGVCLRTHLWCQQQEFAIISIADFSLIHSHTFLPTAFEYFCLLNFNVTVPVLLARFRSSSVVLPRLWNHDEGWGLEVWSKQTRVILESTKVKKCVLPSTWKISSQDGRENLQ